MKATLFLVSILLLIGTVGCGDDDPTSVNPDPLRFGIYVVVKEAGDEASYLTVELAMENSVQIPSFFANGDSVPSFTMYGNIVRGILEIPHAEMVEFTVSSGDRTISGTIDVPRKPDVVTCNGIELSEGGRVEMEATEHYAFAWSGAKAEGYNALFELNGPERELIRFDTVTQGEEWAVDEPIGVPIFFNIAATSGSTGDSGEPPYVSSSWAEGWVFASHKSSRYEFSTPSSKQEEPLVQR